MGGNRAKSNMMATNGDVGSDGCKYTELADGGRIDCQRDARLTGRAGTEIGVYTRIERVAIVIGFGPLREEGERVETEIGVDTPIWAGGGVLGGKEKG
jgi:hypothetical protein